MVICLTFVIIATVLVTTKVTIKKQKQKKEHVNVNKEKALRENTSQNKRHDYLVSRDKINEEVGEKETRLGVVNEPEVEIIEKVNEDYSKEGTSNPNDKVHPKNDEIETWNVVANQDSNASEFVDTTQISNDEEDRDEIPEVMIIQSSQIRQRTSDSGNKSMYYSLQNEKLTTYKRVQRDMQFLHSSRANLAHQELEEECKIEQGP